MDRRTFLRGSAAALATPAIARAAEPRVLRFILQADLAVLDPVWTTAYVTRSHGFAVFGTLYGVNGHFRPRPQMVAGAVRSAGDAQWRLGLLFHEGAPVLARDYVASIKR